MGFDFGGFGRLLLCGKELFWICEFYKSKSGSEM